jgi:hypothetical protein
VPKDAELCNRRRTAKRAVELQLARPGKEWRQYGWNTHMRDARYLRAQAALCLEMARQVSDRATAVNLRAEAARYQAEAAEIETGVKTWELKEPPEQN